MAKSTKNFYAIAKGRISGIYTSWGEAEQQIKGFSGQCFKGFATRDEAEDFMRKNAASTPLVDRQPPPPPAPPPPSSYTPPALEYSSYTPALQYTPYTSALPHTSSPYSQAVAEKRSSNFVDSAEEKRRKTTSQWDWDKDVILISDDSDDDADIFAQQVAAVDSISDRTTTTIGERPPLCEEQLAIINEAKKGRNICYVGSAGSGKSTVLHELRRELQDQGKVVQVLSPTGIVALQINGDTTWRFAGWKPSDVTRPFVEVAQLRDEDTGKQRGVKNLRLKRIRKVDVIIIDEISMVENSFFTRLDWLLREAKDRNKPFGGVQVIITGDFFQLAPVKPVKNCVTCGTKLITDHEDAQYRICTTCKGRFDIEAKFAFCSKSWDECNFLYMSLTKIHRQRDAEFVALLEKCREGSKFAPREIELLECQKPGLDEKKATRLFSTKREVRAVNTKFFNELPGPSVEYRCYDEYERVSSEHPPWYGDRFDKPDTFYDKHDQDDRKKLSGSLRILEDHRWETHLELKKGMRVMLIHNLDIKGSLCNGSQGEVVDFEPFSDSTVPTAQTNNNPEGTIVGAYKHKREAHIRTFANICKAQYEFLGWPIVHFDNGRKKTIYPECTVNEMGAKKPYSLLCRAQVPLTAGYALSIHKSQGMTLDYVMVDLTRTFEIEQIYVALSRARSLDGLLVKGLQESEDRYGGRFSMTGKAVVQKFYNERFGK